MLPIIEWKYDGLHSDWFKSIKYTLCGDYYYYYDYYAAFIKQF